MDWKNPDYIGIMQDRRKKIKRIRKSGEIELIKLYYKDHIADFINDWGMTFDPRNIERGLPAVIPFILFPKQREWIEWLIDHWRRQRDGLTDKSRDAGVSWVAMSVACSQCIFNHGMVVGAGSRKEDYVDKSGDPKALLFKARMFLENLPVEFRAGWSRDTDAHMRVTFPETNSILSGEAGDNIGRGDRTAWYLIDEAAHIERPQLVEASLSQTTNCRMYVSSAKAPTVFSEKRFSGKIDVFTFHWRDDPRKDEEWYAIQQEKLDPVTLAQEVDINYAASTGGILISSEWVQASVDAHLKLKADITGESFASLDVADEGIDLNALCHGKGILIDYIEEWSGKGSDIFATTSHAFRLCDDFKVRRLRYDADGLGADVRGNARVLNESREGRKIEAEAFRGSAGVVDPEKEDVEGSKNEDYFRNLKAQSYWGLRLRFYRTWLAVTKDRVYPHDQLISLSSKMKLLNKLTVELSQPTYTYDGTGHIVVNKKPEGTKSPNLSDAVMMRMARIKRKVRISDSLLAMT